MRISCTQENLQRGLNLVSHLATKNVNLPILNNVLLKSEEGGLVLAATNLEIGIQCKIRAKIEKEGSFTVPANLLSNYVAILSKERIDIELEGKELKISTNKQKTKIKGEGATEFPIIPEVERTQEYVLKKEEIQKSLTQVVFAASLDDTRPEIAGILFDFNDKGLTLAATDSYRLTEKKVSVIKNNQEKQVIVPQSSINELLRVLGITDEEEVKIFITENQILFEVGEVELVSRLIEGNYPDYVQIIPKNFKTTSIINKEEFIKAIKGASLFSKSGINDVNLHFSLERQEITLSAVNAQLGENITKLNAEIKGDSNDIVFNYHYLLDGLGNLDGEELVLEIVDNASPGLLRVKEVKGYLYIIMPIKQ